MNDFDSVFWTPEGILMDFYILITLSLYHCTCSKERQCHHVRLGGSNQRQCVSWASRWSSQSEHHSIGSCPKTSKSAGVQDLHWAGHQDAQLIHTHIKRYSYKCCKHIVLQWVVCHENRLHDICLVFDWKMKLRQTFMPPQTCFHDELAPRIFQEGGFKNCMMVFTSQSPHFHSSSTLKRVLALSHAWIC